MKILGLDSSGLVASVAIAEDDNLLGEYTVNYKKTHSQTLLPMLDEVARIQKEGAAKRKAAEAELGRIEGELKQKLLEINK